MNVRGWLVTMLVGMSVVACQGGSKEAAAPEAVSPATAPGALAAAPEAPVPAAAVLPPVPSGGAEAPTVAQADEEMEEHPEGCPNHPAMKGQAKEALPDTSLFQLGMDFTAQDGSRHKLVELRGKPSVFVMFYGSCKTACPLLFSDATRLEAALPADVREKTKFVFVTIDPERDTPAALNEHAQKLGLDPSRWWLVSTSGEDTRTVAATLGVQYRADGQGEFSHSNRVIVVDPEGRVDLIVEGLRQPMDEASARLTQLARWKGDDGTPSH